MNIELRGCTPETIEAVHKNMPARAVCNHNPGYGSIQIDDRHFNEKKLDKAIHYLLSL